jgi:hypothetical protein
VRNTNKKFIQVKDKQKFIEAILKYQSNGTFISFEGKLSFYGFDKIDGAIKEEDSILKRNVIGSQSDFYVINLNSTNLNSILSILKVEDALEWDIFHIKIANTNETVFESYDWFSDCYLNIDFYSSSFINNLTGNNIIQFV